jgi:sugar phosphate isomerase/epimerase
MKKLTRRQVLAASSVVVGSAVAPRLARAQADPKNPFVYCLNTSTISGQKLSLVQELELAAKVGYTAVEPWVREIEAYQKQGGSMADLRKRISDLGLTIEDVIGFAQWIVDDESARKKALEQAKRDMDLGVQIGSKRIAAPPAGATDRPDLDLRVIAERYRTLLELGDKMGIVAMVELWGFSQILNNLGQVAFVAIESHHPKACILPDVYHMYKGGGGPTGLRLLSAQAIQMIHINDYPAQPSREKIDDAARVFPGDGVAPLAEILRDLRGMGGRCVLSLELFNRQYWKLDAMVCAKTGLEKVKAAVLAM